MQSFKFLLQIGIWEVWFMKSAQSNAPQRPDTRKPTTTTNFWNNHHGDARWTTMRTRYKNKESTINYNSVIQNTSSYMQVQLSLSYLLHSRRYHNRKCSGPVVVHPHPKCVCQKIVSLWKEKLRALHNAKCWHWFVILLRILPCNLYGVIKQMHGCCSLRLLSWKSHNSKKQENTKGCKWQSPQPTCAIVCCGDRGCRLKIAQIEDNDVVPAHHCRVCCNVDSMCLQDWQQGDRRLPIVGWYQSTMGKGRRGPSRPNRSRFFFRPRPSDFAGRFAIYLASTRRQIPQSLQWNDRLARQDWDLYNSWK